MNQSFHIPVDRQPSADIPITEIGRGLPIHFS